jgi:hypothetical protein
MTKLRLSSAASAQAAAVRVVDIDMTLTDSFPASDPPSWTAATAEAGPAAATAFHIDSTSCIVKSATKFEAPETPPRRVGGEI